MTPRGNSDHDELLTIQELADALKRSRRYIQAMRQLGFPMPGERATVNEAREFLKVFPWPTAARWRKQKK